MSPKLKKILKVCGTTIGICAGVGVLSLAWIGAGEVFREQYHDPDNWQNTVYQSSRYGWSLKLKDGWVA